MRFLMLTAFLAACSACGASNVQNHPDAAAPEAGAQTASLPLAHMNDGTVIVASLADGSVAKVIPNVPTARGIVVANDVGMFFVTSSPNQLVAIDNKTLAEVRRVTTGTGPDGVGWDSKDQVVAT